MLDSTTSEGKTAYIFGSNLEDNPYRKAKEKMLSGEINYDDNRYANLMDLECQWDSGFYIGKRQNEI